MNRAVLALILASVLWGTTGTAASRMTGVSPVAIGASTMAVGGALLFGASARVSMRALRDRAARRWVLLGAVGVVVYPLAFYTGMHLAGIAIGNVVALGSGPAFAALLEWILGGRRPGPRWLAATGVAVAGVVVLGVAGRASPRATGAPGQEVAVGLLLALAAGAAYALYTYSAGRVTALGHGGRAAMGGTFGVGAVILLPILLATGGPILADDRTIALAAYLAIGPMLLAYLLFGVGIRSLRSTVVTTITLLEPIVATVLAVVVVGERLTAAGWTGIALIGLGVGVLISAPPAPEVERHP
ncbi:EamA family transporter [Galbitalea soli]|uniref:EamA family transporter n=1 Tax=Galbitalea soli TaxID=1268042 RepID=A0A7C9PLT2_9MICO|nr:EamA family transporter [Galbitalea soli]NYJ31015.1 DME family drug/metabolite transporter [Galbitalea soli]